MPLFVGIDPGLHGAVAAYFADARSRQILEVHDLPVAIREIDAVRFRALLDGVRYRHGLSALTILEEQQAFPEQGVASAYLTGFNFGQLVGVLAAAGWSFERVYSKDWKRRLDVAADKKEACLRASQLMPEGAQFWLRVKDDGRAEAALLAYYAHRCWQQRDPLLLRTP